MNELYLAAVKIIKTAILKSQNRAAEYANREMLSLYYSIGAFVSQNSRDGKWGSGALEEISARLHEELPGLRGFSEGNLKLMRRFYEEWQPHLHISPVLAPPGNSVAAATELEKSPSPLAERDIFEHRPSVTADLDLADFLAIGFTHHMEILHKTTDVRERCFYISLCARRHWSKYALRSYLKQDLYHHQGALPNNFERTISDDSQYLQAVRTFKDEYLLDFINTEELDLTDPQDMDERTLEHEIIAHIRNFIQCLGPGFCFVGNQHRIEVDGEEFFADLLFFQRDLKALVVVELKTGKFKPAYLGQLDFYLSALDRQERKNGENPSIGILLCREANRNVVELAIRDYTKPMGVATYRTVAELPEKLRVLAPIIEEVPKLLKVKDIETVEDKN